MFEKEVTKELVKKHNLNRIENIRLDSEAKLTKLKIEYAIVMARQQKISLYKSLVFYAGLKRFTQKLPNKKFKKIEYKIKAIDLNTIDNYIVTEIWLTLFLNSDYVKDICRRKSQKSCFFYDIWNDKNLNIHFRNAVVPRNPLRGEELDNRIKELRKIAQKVKKHHPHLKGIFSASWMWNLELFRDLMPKDFNSSLKEFKKNKFYSLGHWGQFYRYNGKLNLKRIREFKKDWKFPFKILVGQCKIKYFFEKYNI